MNKKKWINLSMAEWMNESIKKWMNDKWMNEFNWMHNNWIKEWNKFIDKLLGIINSN